MCQHDYSKQRFKECIGVCSCFHSYVAQIFAVIWSTSGSSIHCYLEEDEKVRTIDQNMKRFYVIMYDCGIMQVILESEEIAGGILMCCRFHIRENDPEMTSLVDAALQSPLMAQISKNHPATLVRSGEVFPTNLVAAVATNRQMQPAVFPMLWGFTIQGRQTAIVNARTETAAEKPSFRESWKTHRCIVPASWYI